MSKKTRIEFQEFLNRKGAQLVEDGVVGPKTRDAAWRLFANLNAPPIKASDIHDFAHTLNVSPLQVRAVAAVESSGGGFLPSGHPKILWERHWFWRRLRQVIPATGIAGHFIAHPDPGGYTLDADRDGLNDSWEKLIEACRQDPVSAFESCSWGKFQVMGGHWKSLGYRSVFDMAWSMVESERNHYQALVNFIRANNLRGAMSRISTNPEHNRDFARGYNGRNYKKNQYHLKLAQQMGR